MSYGYRMLLPSGGGKGRTYVRLCVNCDAEWLRRNAKLIYTAICGLSFSNYPGSASSSSYKNGNCQK